MKIGSITHMAFIAGLLVLLSTGLRAQSLAIQGDHFAVAGQGKFLVFVSYFDGLRRTTTLMDTDLSYLHSKGIDGVRVLTNWESPYLMDSSGSLNATVLSKLVSLVDHAAAHGLLVDVTFNHERVPGIPHMTFDAYKWGPGNDPQGSDHHGGIKGTAEALHSRHNVVFDLQNEWNSTGIPDGCTLGSTEACLRNIVDQAVKPVDPTRLVTASKSGANTSDEGAVVNFVKTWVFDVLAYHEGRGATWAADTDDVVARLRANLRQSPTAITPVYLQEPCRFNYSGCTNVETDYETAVANAKSAGAAAWTFHNGASFDLSGGLSFQALLLTDEQLFLDNVVSATGVTWGVTYPLRFLTPVDFEGDSRSDLAVYRPSTGQWFVRTTPNGPSSTFGPFGVSTDIPRPLDFDHDGRIDLSVYRASTGFWYIVTSSSEYTAQTSFQYGGLAGDIPLAAEFNGDGLNDVAIYRTTGVDTGKWFVRPSPNGPSITYGPFGNASDIPRPLDFDGDGKADLCVYRPSTGEWFILTSSSGYTAQTTFPYGGLAGDIALTADFNGDGRDDVAIYRTTGVDTGKWFVRPSPNGPSITYGPFGFASDVPRPIDYDADGRADLGIYRPSTSQWFILTSSSGYASGYTIPYGNVGDLPVHPVF